MDYLSDQEGIMQRYINEEGRWNFHLSQTKQYIKDVIKKKEPETVAILGSGWLLDIPADFLGKHCKKVYFYDIFHPSQVRHKLRAFENFVFIECDITGGYIEEMYKTVNLSRKNKNKVPVENLKKCRFQPEQEADYTFSVNILNQLDILIIDYLKNFRVYSDQELDKIRAVIQNSHIFSLTPGKAAIITDYLEMIYDDIKEQPIERQLLYTELPEGKNRKYWDWDFDMNMTYNEGKITKFRVVGLEL